MEPADPETIMKRYPPEIVKFRADPWAAHRGKYEVPTRYEYIVMPFARTYDFEKHEFVEKEDFIKYLHQVRESKGYDVDRAFGFSNLFPDHSVSEHRRAKGMEAAKFVMTKINDETIPSGKSYELVSYKFVCALENRCYLLTISVEEVDVDGEDVIMLDEANALKTIRAMVFDDMVSLELVEWKFKA